MRLALYSFMVALAFFGVGIDFAPSCAFAQGVPPIEGSAPALNDTSGADLPFTNNNANQPVLSPMTAQGLENMGDADAAAHHEKKGGLPQFDPTTFSKQIFWLLLTFGFMYALFSAKILPDISAVIDNRQNVITSDLRAAEVLKTEVNRVMGEYETAIQAARAQAQNTLNGLQDDMKRKAEANGAQFKQHAEKATHDIEVSIATQKSRIMNDLGSIAADLTADITRVVANMPSDTATARREIDRLTQKKEAA